MMILRVALTVVLALDLLAAPLVGEGQPAPTVHRIGVLDPTPSTVTSGVDGLRAGLQDLGYVEGKNVVIELRLAKGKYDRLPDLAAELVRVKADVLVTFGTAATLAAKAATTTIPIVMLNTGDAVATGLVANLARPGGNITGTTILSPELMAKKLELLKEASPRVRHVAVLLNPANPAQSRSFEAMLSTASLLKLRLQKFEPRAPDEYAAAFAAMARQHIEALAIGVDTMFRVNARALADLAAEQRLPSAANTEFADAGGLIGHGVNFPESWRRGAYFVDKLLNGAKPADLPVERPTKFELVINLRTAKALGLTMPQALLLRADRVIE